MRINHYRFPEDSNIEDRINEGCACILKSGYEYYAKDYNDYLDHKDLVDQVDDTLGGLTVSAVKKLMRKYGGYGFTYHCERDGSVFETSEITLTGNNSRFKYNHHL